MVFGDPTLLQQLPQQGRGFLELSGIAYMATQLFQGNPDIVCAWSSMNCAVQYGDNTEDKQKNCERRSIHLPSVFRRLAAGYSDKGGGGGGTPSEAPSTSTRAASVFENIGLRELDVHVIDALYTRV